MTASIAAGVSRFLPADFASNLTISLHRQLNINKDKVITEDCLQKHESSISHTCIGTGPLLDFCLSRDVLIHMKERSITLFDFDDKRFSTTTMPTASVAIVAVFKMVTAPKTCAFEAQDIVTTQSRLLELGKEITPGAEWTVKPGSAAEMAEKASEAFKADPNSRMAAMMQKAVGVLGQEYTSDFGEADNAELGIRVMDGTQLKEMLMKFA